MKIKSGQKEGTMSHNAKELLEAYCTINYKGDLKMNKDKRVTVRFTKKEYETLKSKSKVYGIENLSLYIRKKMLVNKDEYLSNASKIRKLYDHLAQLEMEFETIKNEAGLSEYDILGYEREFANMEEELKKIK